MGNISRKFTRFPHHCEIYTFGEVTPFSTGERVVIWSGACRKEGNTSIRTFTGTDRVVKTNYRVQLGNVDETGALVEGIRAGMLIDVTDKQGTFVGMQISDAYCGILGTTVYCEDPKN